ncbi:MAG TPA: PssD/Cps14F family polysaccharide biosynthesis glycosyltransferase [Solirubrobacterales bacterium]|jgi:UDP-N-acetylglucosamine:LPS N-acetylglucosamine transferase|nr:PssD/Cps14F family polysaccharide biosynthesis glycosyltransferase [Solirubrobacterales bacterium]
MKRRGAGSKRILIVASPGGHLLQMLALEPAWSDAERVWVTLRSTDVEYLLQDEKVVYGHGPTPRNIGNFLRNLRLAGRILRQYDPGVVVSTGAGLALPFFLLGRLQRRRLVYVESITRVEKLALTGRLVYPLADAFFVQWDSLGELPRARFHGSVA